MSRVSFFLQHLAANLSNRLAISAPTEPSTHGKFLFQAAFPDNGHCPRDRVARVYIFRVCAGAGEGVFGGACAGRQVKSGGEKEAAEREREHIAPK